VHQFNRLHVVGKLCRRLGPRTAYPSEEHGRRTGRDRIHRREYVRGIAKRGGYEDNIDGLAFQHSHQFRDVLHLADSYSRRICSNISTLSLLLSQLRFFRAIHEAYPVSSGGPNLTAEGGPDYCTEITEAAVNHIEYERDGALLHWSVFSYGLA
jgi:hypothetical protein